MPMLAALCAAEPATFPGLEKYRCAFKEGTCSSLSPSCRPPLARLRLSCCCCSPSLSASSWALPPLVLHLPRRAHPADRAETVQDMFMTPLYQQHASHTLASRVYGPQLTLR